MLPRLATEEDIAQLQTLYEEFHLFHVVGVPDRLRLSQKTEDNANEPNELESGLRAIIAREDAVLFVLEIDAKLIGFAEVYLRQDEEHPVTVAHRYGYLQSLMVSAPYRKQGLGEALLHAVHQWTQEKGATEVRLDAWEFVAGPVPFYEKYGYRTLKRTMVVDIS